MARSSRRSRHALHVYGLWSLTSSNATRWNLQLLSGTLRLVKDAADWNAVHAPTTFSLLPQFDPWRVYVDVLHCLDLACTTDCLSSLLAICGGNDSALETLRLDYYQWCKDLQIKDKATHKLFKMKVLQPSGEYPSLSQKIIKGGAARMMSYWGCLVAFRYCVEHGMDPYFQTRDRQ